MRRRSGEYNATRSDAVLSLWPKAKVKIFWNKNMASKEECKEEQISEIEALESIYPEELAGDLLSTFNMIELFEFMMIMVC